jgi:uncharacterized RDD family membrane protein YckC
VTDLVTGEAVLLDLRLAKLASRSLALAIDLVVQVGALFVGTFLIVGTATFVDDALAAAIGLVFSLLVVVGYPTASETLTRGRSLGKMALGLRVVREDGGPIRFRHALLRALMSVVEIWITFGSVALITSLASAQGRRVGDFLAGTVVVRERVSSSAGAAATMPPPLAGWAMGLDLSRVPDDLALAARQFLGRAHELAPDVRDRMARALVGSLAAVTAPPPPPGTPDWAFLSAVLAERRRRELARLQPPTYQPAPGYGAPPPYWPAPGPGAPPAYHPSAHPPPPPPPAPYPPAPPAGPGSGDGPFAPPG